MGRLFWKILLTFWLTLLVMGGATGITVWLHQHALQSVQDDLVIRPSSVLAVKAAANTLLFGGKARHCQDFSICPPLTANACYGLVSGQLL